jgi:hypothetical protein
VLTTANPALAAPGVDQLGACYKQLNSSVGQFGTDTLIASTAGLESSSPGDAVYTQTEHTLTWLDNLRDAVAGEMKLSLDAAAFADHPVFLTGVQTALCDGLLHTADQLSH